MSDIENHGTLERLGKDAYPVVFMFVATFLTTGMLVGIVRLTEARVQANRRVLVERAVITALDIGGAGRIPPSRVHEIFMERVAQPDGTSDDAYRLLESGRVAAYAVPFEGRGFWNIIRGFVGIRADRRTLIGIAFYEQSETPGLGAEIVQPRFRDQFKGLRLRDAVPSLRFKPVGTETAEGEVHAITGATQTCARLERIVSERLDRWRERMGPDGESAASGKGEEEP